MCISRKRTCIWFHDTKTIWIQQLCSLKWFVIERNASTKPPMAHRAYVTSGVKLMGYYGNQGEGWLSNQLHYRVTPWGVWYILNNMSCIQSYISLVSGTSSWHHFRPESPMKQGDHPSVDICPLRLARWAFLGIGCNIHRSEDGTSQVYNMSLE